MAVVYDNIIVAKLIKGNAVDSDSYYTRIDSNGDYVWTGKGAQSGHATSNDYYLPLSVISLSAGVHASPEADSYISDKAGNTYNAFVIDGGDVLKYPNTNVLTWEQGSIAFMWKPFLSSTQITENFYLFHAPDFIDIYYNKSDGKLYFTILSKTLSTSFTFSNTWTKLAFVYDASATDKLIIYKDSSTPIATYTGSAWSEPESMPDWFYWGCKSSGTSPDEGTNQADSIFDKLSIYAKPLTSNQVNELFSIWS